MDSNPSTVTIWQSGRLVPQGASRRFEFAFDRAQWLGAALLVLSAVVLALFVAVLERDVHRGEMAHQAQRTRALAQAQCEGGDSVQSRGACTALLNGAPADVETADAATGAVDDGGARPSAVSMNSLQAPQ
jgi:uncharacterized membrane protein YcjF (UPF0283 family)